MSFATMSDPKYVLIKVDITCPGRMENGPIVCGDEKSDPGLMAFLNAVLGKEAFALSTVSNKVYSSRQPLHIILNKLATRGYKVVSSCGAGNTCIWTLSLCEQ